MVRAQGGERMEPLEAPPYFVASRNMSVRLKLMRVQFLEARTSLKWQLSLLIAEEVEAVPDSDLSGAPEQEWVFT